MSKYSFHLEKSNYFHVFTWLRVYTILYSSEPHYTYATVNCLLPIYLLYESGDFTPEYMLLLSSCITVGQPTCYAHIHILCHTLSLPHSCIIFLISPSTPFSLSVYCCCCLANISIPGIGVAVPEFRPFFYVNVADISALENELSYVACKWMLENMFTFVKSHTEKGLDGLIFNMISISCILNPRDPVCVCMLRYY